MNYQTQTQYTLSEIISLEYYLQPKFKKMIHQDKIQYL